MRLFGPAVIILAAASSLPAEDFWLVKNPETWTALEIKQMVTDSPWAKQAGVGWPAAGTPISGNSAGQQTPGKTAPLAPEIIVRWESASPILEACAKGGMERHLFSCVSKLLYLSGLANKFEQLKKDFYIVGLSNYPRPPRQSGVTEHSEAGNAALETMSRGIQESTFLRFKSRSPMLPANVIALPAGQSVLVIIFFPRTDAISLSDREVSFESALGAMQLKATFPLQEMRYRGALDL